MKLSELAIQRPVTTLMAIICIFALGLVSLTFLPLEFLPEFSSSHIHVWIPYASSSPEEVETVKRVYAVIEKLPAKERIPFTLRYIGEMDLVEVADVCEVSLATIKRRLKKGRQHFMQHAKRDPYLNQYLSHRDGRHLEPVP